MAESRVIPELTPDRYDELLHRNQDQDRGSEALQFPAAPFEERVF